MHKAVLGYIKNIEKEREEDGEQWTEDEAVGAH